MKKIPKRSFFPHSLRDFFPGSGSLRLFSAFSFFRLFTVFVFSPSSSVSRIFYLSEFDMLSGRLLPHLPLPAYILPDRLCPAGLHID